MRSVIFFLVFSLSAFSALANPVKEKYDEAMAAFTSEDYIRSIGLFEETLKLYPNFAQPYNFIAMAKKELNVGDEEIMVLLNKAIEIDPNFSLAHDNLGKMYYGQGEFYKAQEHARKALELSPDLLTARLSLGWICLLGLGETREAIRYFETAVAQQRTDYGIFGLGMAYFMDHQRGRVLEMITDLRQEGNESLAKSLEDMVRHGRYLPPEGIQSLIHPSAPRKRETAASTQPSAPAPSFNYPVRLSGKLEESATGANSLNGSSPQAAISGEERIRQLQRNLPSHQGY